MPSKVTHYVPQMKAPKEKLIWTFPLRYLFEGCLELTISVTIGIIKLRWDEENYHVIISNIFAIVMITVMAIFPLFLILNYPCRKARIHEKEFKDKYGDLYSGWVRVHHHTNVCKN